MDRVVRVVCEERLRGVGEVGEGFGVDGASAVGCFGGAGRQDVFGLRGANVLYNKEYLEFRMI